MPLDIIDGTPTFVQAIKCGGGVICWMVMHIHEIICKWKFGMRLHAFKVAWDILGFWNRVMIQEEQSKIPLFGVLKVVDHLRKNDTSWSCLLRFLELARHRRQKSHNHRGYPVKGVVFNNIITKDKDNHTTTGVYFTRICHYLTHGLLYPIPTPTPLHWNWDMDM